MVRRCRPSATGGRREAQPERKINGVEDVDALALHGTCDRGGATDAFGFERAGAIVERAVDADEVDAVASEETRFACELFGSFGVV
mgnify:CR=1 FL=1